MDTGQKLSQFEDRVRQQVSAVFPQVVLSVVDRGRYRLKIRIELGETIFIDIFYNPKNDRTDFALIRNNQRIFGYDNLGGWHCHPAEDPKTHTPCDEPPLDQIFQEMRIIFVTLVESSNDHF